MMTSALVFLLLCCCVTFSQGDEKFNQLVKLAKRSPVIHFNSADSYHKLIGEANRNYSVFVLFTATAAKYKCGPCAQLADEFRQFGVSYEAYYGDYDSNKEFLEKPFFLAQVEPDQCMEVFQTYQFQTVPHFAHIPAGSKKVAKLRDDQFLRNPQASVNDIIDFVHKKAGPEIPVYMTLFERFAPLGSVILFAFLVIRIVRKYRSAFYSPMLWYLMALVTYMIVMAGVVYNRTRKPPFMDVQNGRAQLIARSPRTQYVAEGMVIAVVLGGAGVLFVILGDFVPRLTGPKRRVAFWISAVLLFMFLTTLNNIYMMKYGSGAFRLNWRLF